MAKDKEPKVKGPASIEEAQATLTSTKEELGIARDEKKAYMKEHGLKKGEDYSADAKHGKKLTKWQETISNKEETIESLKTYISENKPKKEPKVRETTYTYPLGEDGKEMSAGDKKKHRAKMRAEKKRAEKEAAGGGEKKEKKEKKAKSDEAPAGDAKADAGKSDKKKKKKESAESTSGDD